MNKGVGSNYPLLSLMRVDLSIYAICRIREHISPKLKVSRKGGARSVELTQIPNGIWVGSVAD